MFKDFKYKLWCFRENLISKIYHSLGIEYITEKETRRRIYRCRLLNKFRK